MSLNRYRVEEFGISDIMFLAGPEFAHTLKALMKISYLYRLPRFSHPKLASFLRLGCALLYFGHAKVPRPVLILSMNSQTRGFKVCGVGSKAVRLQFLGRNRNPSQTPNSSAPTTLHYITPNPATQNGLNPYIPAHPPKPRGPRAGAF